MFRRPYVNATLVVLTLAMVGLLRPGLPDVPDARATDPDRVDAPTSADDFRFVPGSAVDVVSLHHGTEGLTTFRAATAAGGWDTAMLGVAVRADASAEPFIEIQTAGQSERQYFRSRESGRRWLNLSTFHHALRTSSEITLRGHGVVVAEDIGTLRLFRAAPDLTGTILVLAPHPDDAEIASFGLYSGRNASIVTMTAGNAGPPLYSDLFDRLPELYDFKGRIRVIDSVTVPWQGGIPPERCFNLGYFDGQLAAMYDNPDAAVSEAYSPNTDVAAYRQYNIGNLLPKTSRTSSWSNMVADLTAVLEKVQPTIIVVPHPELDTHTDHQATTVALAEALQIWQKPVTLLLYVNHAADEQYPYGPAGTLVSLPPPVASSQPIVGLYSHPVDQDTQRRKLFALESMHDLRLSPTVQYRTSETEARSLNPEGQEPLSGYISYLRRASRSNELYFVFDRTTFVPLIEDVRAGWNRRGTR